jgi:hypothetical protein
LPDEQRPRERVACICNGISYGSIERGYRQLCGRCFNEGIARTDGIDFQHVEFQPLEMSGAAGQRHEFHFRASARRSGCPECLRVARRRALRHLKYDKQFGWTIANFMVRSSITRDAEQDGRVLDDTHEDWQRLELTMIHDLEAVGRQIRKVPVDIEALAAWCRERNCCIDVVARDEYVSYLTGVKLLLAQRKTGKAS